MSEPRAPKVLVAEDNEAAREAHALALRRAGYEVATAADGEQALALLRAGPAPDLLILDMLLPALDGWHLLGRLQREGPTVRVLVATGTMLTREWAADHGCAGFLRKPFDEEDLVAEARRCLGPSGGPEEAH
jgi:CheY-like chemotaxis protein